MRATNSGVSAEGRLATLARLALEAEAPGLAREAEALAERLREGRFYVVCVGQFKRGKSTLINALVGHEVLPVGVVPITAAVTVVRYGERLGARVRFGDRDWEECEPGALATYVSEQHNPGNEKSVSAVEVFVPHPLLESGMCLVDTPGIGSVSAANTAATRAFVPHIDAALVVLGADPPISGEELALVRDIARRVDELIFVLNKADRLDDTERIEAIRFTERVVSATLGRSTGVIFQVSGAARLAGTGPPRDWDALMDRLDSLARRAGADLVRAAERRGTAVLVDRLLADLAEQEAALRRPVAESQARVEALRRAVGEAEHALDDLAHRLTAVEERLYRVFTDERDRYFATALPRAQDELRAMIRDEPIVGPGLRKRAVEYAIQVTRRWLARWKEDEEPRAERLYREAVSRFVELVNGLERSVTGIPGLERFSPVGIAAAFSAKSRFYLTEMHTVAPASAGSWVLDVLGRGLRTTAIERHAMRYLQRLLETNSARLKNDFQARVVESRRQLEADVRARLHELVTSAERALHQARQARAAGAAAIEARLGQLARLKTEAQILIPPSQSG